MKTNQRATAHHRALTLGRDNSIGKQRAVLLANMALADRGYEILECRFLQRGAGGDPLLKSFIPPNFAVWENGAKLIPMIVYMNRGRPARVPRFDHYLLQVNSAAAKGGTTDIKNRGWVMRNFRLLRSDFSNNDMRYQSIPL